MGWASCLRLGWTVRNGDFSLGPEVSPNKTQVLCRWATHDHERGEEKETEFLQIHLKLPTLAFAWPIPSIFWMDE
jgi:hypothetical protein